MAGILEDRHSEDCEFNNFMDSGNISDEEDESDYEARLYSLVHYSDEAIAGDKISEALIYECKKSKASRLDRVRSIINDGNNSTHSGIKGSEHAKTKPQLVYMDPKRQEELRKLVDSYNRATSSLSHLTQISEKIFQKTPPRKSFTPESHPVNSRGNNIFHVNNHTASIGYESRLSVSGCFDAYASDDASTSFVGVNSIKKTASRSKVVPESLENNTENHTVHKSSKQKASDERVKGKKSTSCVTLSDTDTNSSKCNSPSKRVPSEPSLNDDKNDCSKYNVGLKKDKLNVSVGSLVENHKSSKSDSHSSDEKKKTVEEVIIVSDGNDSDSSVREVEPSVKKLPPVVCLTSDEEVKDQERKMEEEQNEITIVYSSETAVSKRASGGIKLKESVKKKKKSKSKSKKQQPSRLHTNDGINPPSWTDSMLNFYNNSWGGEHFDVNKVQRTMSGKRSKWPVLYTDFVPSSRNHVKCNNCSTFGHGARACPEPVKPDVCLFCGKTGHLKSKCPTPICLRCGRPSLMYNYGCPQCSSSINSNETCSECKLTGHHHSECPEIWRKFHSTITEDNMASKPKTIYKPRNQQFCSNCAARGHQYHECGQSSKQGNWLKRTNNSPGKFYRESKRRKLDYSRCDRSMQGNAKYRNRTQDFMNVFRPLYRPYMY